MAQVKCPQCGSKVSLPVVYGTLDETLIQAIEDGELLHGGCAISGLMQAHYCPVCDVRYDDLCMDEFMNKLKKLSYQDKHQSFTLDFYADYMVLTQDQHREVVVYTSSHKHALAQTQLEYWSSLDQGTWTIDLILPDYFRDHIHLKGTKEKPYAYLSLAHWFELLNIKIL